SKAWAINCPACGLIIETTMLMVKVCLSGGWGGAPTTVFAVSKLYSMIFRWLWPTASPCLILYLALLFAGPSLSAAPLLLTGGTAAAACFTFPQLRTPAMVSMGDSVA